MLGAKPPRKPITGISFCCAPAESGYAAAPARTVMKFRRLIHTPALVAGGNYGVTAPLPIVGEWEQSTPSADFRTVKDGPPSIGCQMPWRCASKLWSTLSEP